MRKALIITALVLYNAFAVGQGSGTITGKIVNSETGEPMQGATVTVRSSLKTAVANSGGIFKIEQVTAGKINLLITHIGFEPLEKSVQVLPGEIISLTVSLVLTAPETDNIVVSASRRPEKITYAPAAIHIINTKDLNQSAVSNVNELMAYIPGIEYTRTGVDVININARGFNSAFNNKILYLVDGRNSMGTGSGGLPMFDNGTTIKDDIDRVEVMLGPQSALYGPNAHNGLINVITKDPRLFPGTTIAVSGGSQYQFSGRFRQATRLSQKLAFKISGEYARGKEFEFYDSVYAGGGAFGEPVAIPERNVDFNYHHIRGEMHFYYTLSPRTDLIVSAGASDNDFLQVTTSSRNQMIGLKNSFLQARLIRRNFFVTVYNAWGTVGSGYIIQNYTRDFWNRTHSSITNPNDPRFPVQGYLSPAEAEDFALRYGNRFKDQNQRINAEAQYNYDFKKPGLALVAGISYQKDKPNGFGITLVDKERRIYVTQYGAVLQLQKSLPWSAKFIGAARLDHHSKFGDFASPKIALVKNVQNGAFRITWGRAYSMPSILSQSANISGFLFGNGDGISYIPNSSKFSDPSAIKVTTPLKPEQVSTWEFGYRGKAGKNLHFDFNFYNGLSKNFITPTITVDGRALKVGNVPVTPLFAGVVTNDTLKNASFITYFNYGNVRVFGADLGLRFALTDKLSMAVNYSWFDSDLKNENLENDANGDGYLSAEEKSLNAPHNRGLVMLKMENVTSKKGFVNVAARFVEHYDFYSGIQIGTKPGEGKRGKVYGGTDKITGQERWYLKNFDWGPLGGFVSLDLNAGANLSKLLSLALNVTNLFNTTQREFVGAPSIGRLFVAELKFNLAGKSKSNVPN